jgi:hypothetical protein
VPLVEEYRPPEDGRQQVLVFAVAPLEDQPQFRFQARRAFQRLEPGGLFVSPFGSPNFVYLLAYQILLSQFFRRNSENNPSTQSVNKGKKIEKLQIWSVWGMCQSAQYSYPAMATSLFVVVRLVRTG